MGRTRPQSKGKCEMLQGMTHRTIAKLLGHLHIIYIN